MPAQENHGPSSYRHSRLTADELRRRRLNDDDSYDMASTSSGSAGSTGSGGGGDRGSTGSGSGGSGGINRSLSFTSGLRRGSHRGSMSPSPTGTGTKTPVLGQAYRASPMISRKSSPAGSIGFSFKKNHKIPKVPRPARAMMLFDSLKKGLRECVEATREDVESLRSIDDGTSTSTNAQGRAIEIEKQMRAAERYAKRIEFHLARVEELEENYVLHTQLREGVRTMAKAYATTPTNHQKESLSNVKCGYKECSQTMCAIEALLENMLGTFQCQMRGLAGFARLIPGDVYSVGITHGQQKWKTKGRVGSSGQQWENDTFLFKALVGEVFAIKAVEVRHIAKSVILGQKNCETKDLFSSHPQMMTVNMNTTGSIKLSIIITWNPLDGVDESMTFFITDPTKSQGTPSRRRFPFSPSLDSQLRNLVNGDVELRQRGSTNSSLSSRDSNQRLSVPSNMQYAPMLNGRNLHPNQPYHHPSSMAGSTSSQGSYTNGGGGRLRPQSIAVMGSLSESHAESMDLNVHKPRLFDMRMLAESLEGVGGAYGHHQDGVASLEEALNNLRSALEDCRGHYPELQKLDEQIQNLHQLVEKNRTSGSNGSSEVSISIENALGAFDFLESEDYEGGYVSSSNSRRNSIDKLEEQCTLSPESTTNTRDSGIESIANRLSEDRNFGSSLSSSPEPPSTGNDQVDDALLWHLAYCDRLVENLGNFGPLKCKEIYSLDKLRRQADIIEHLIAVAQTGPHVPDIHSVMRQICRRKKLAQFWAKCLDGNVLYINSEMLLAHLERCYGPEIRQTYDINASKVFRCFLARVLDIPTFDPEMNNPPNVTLHQLFTFFRTHDLPDIDQHLLDIAGEMWMCSRLRSGNTDIVIKTMITFRDRLPPADCLRIIALLLITDNAEIANSAVSFIRGLGVQPALRDKALIVYLEALEDRNADVRCAACIAVRLMKAVEALDQLVFVCQTDSSHMVKAKAKEALLSFGDEGRKAFEQSQLSAHGFQGVQVRH